MVGQLHTCSDLPASDTDNEGRGTPPASDMELSESGSELSDAESISDRESEVKMLPVGNNYKFDHMQLQGYYFLMIMNDKSFGKS